MGDSSYIVTYDMLDAEERLILGSISHLGEVIVMCTPDDSMYIFSYKCVVGDSPASYEDTVRKVLQKEHDYLYNLLFQLCLDIRL